MSAQKEVDRDDAPEGYYALGSNGKCTGCAFCVPRVGCELPGVPPYNNDCTSKLRRDGRDVIFKKKEGGG